MIPSQPDGRYDASSMSGTQAFFCSWTSVARRAKHGFDLGTEKKKGTRAGMSCGRGTARAREYRGGTTHTCPRGGSSHSPVRAAQVSTHYSAGRAQHRVRASRTEGQRRRAAAAVARLVALRDADQHAVRVVVPAPSECASRPRFKNASQRIRVLRGTSVNGARYVQINPQLGLFFNRGLDFAHRPLLGQTCTSRRSRGCR